MIRRLSAWSDFTAELEQLLDEARDAGLDDDQLAAHLRKSAEICDARYDAEAEAEDDVTR